MLATPWSEGSTIETDNDVSVGALLVFTHLATAAGKVAAVYMFAACLHLWCCHAVAAVRERDGSWWRDSPSVSDHCPREDRVSALRAGIRLPELVV